MRGIRIYRRRLPHWRGEGATYFVTWRVHPDQDELSPDERDLVVSALRYFEGERYRLHAFVVMNDHVHTLVTPAKGHSLERMVRSWKSFSANQFHQSANRVGPVWQDEYMDHIIRSPAEFIEKSDYIVNNPSKRWPHLSGYQWVGRDQDP
jgi:REP element-mobilizing transposase RayT